MPVFASAGTGATAVYIVVFLILVGVWCAAGRYIASRPVVARVLRRWHHYLLPVVLVLLGLGILIEGRAFGL